MFTTYYKKAKKREEAFEIRAKGTNTQRKSLRFFPRSSSFSIRGLNNASRARRVPGQLFGTEAGRLCVVWPHTIQSSPSHRVGTKKIPGTKRSKEGRERQQETPLDSSAPTVYTFFQFHCTHTHTYFSVPFLQLYPFLSPLSQLLLVCSPGVVIRGPPSFVHTSTAAAAAAVRSRDPTLIL